MEGVNNVGPATSKAIAREYETLEGLRASDRERLEGVYGVGLLCINSSIIEKSRPRSILVHE
ncbi:helix-hairpin-helix domain-containing protein [Natrinema hispanicum]|uniref:helix-hairpin-helix domain-containing protein n=1 Tax=Natrinema hispanicum TaxID=392421 RepID=UPI002407DBB5|nr:helix-hairpin-helix domain-containing protein [Natrinema hispanicum]